jgi:hypothetical protein
MSKRKEKIQIFTEEDLMKAKAFHFTVFNFTVQNARPTTFYVKNFYKALTDEFDVVKAKALFEHIHGKPYEEKFKDAWTLDVTAIWNRDERGGEADRDWF